MARQWAKSTVIGMMVMIYPVTLKGGEATYIRLQMSDSLPLVLCLFDENENQNLIDSKTATGSEIGINIHTPVSRGMFYIAVGNPGDDAANFAIIAN